MADSKQKKNEEENRLLHLVAEGNQQAFAQIMQQYTRIIYPYLLYWLKHTHDAEEVLQDVFMLIWRNREKLAMMDNFSGYIYVIARNRTKSAIKEKLPETDDIQTRHFDAIITNPDYSLEFKEMAKVVEDAVDALPARRREVFLLSRTENLTYEEIAVRLSISRSTVREHIVKALVFLRQYIREHSGIIISCLAWLLAYG